ncbi:hypothetical protein DRO69_03775 [Candidatus Bathyarchaeota archaeon]|nr:MAG: hypothetical protein DRO69_03775 [Candidatus Bathyarchaeota archaeon]
MDAKKRTTVLGLVFLACLALAYVENVFFFRYVKGIFFNPPVAVMVVFIHNVLAISLILVGMSFYVDFVLTFSPKRKYEYLVLQNPRLFAFIFTIMILLISIFRASTLLHGQVIINTLAPVILISAPNGVIEGYGIFQCIQKTLKKNMTLKDLAFIYSIFFIAAVLEVGLVQALLWISSR